MFFTLLIAGTLLVVVMFLVSSYTFNRAFLGYINRAETDHLQALVISLEEQYAQDLSWENTVSNREVWARVIKNGTVNFKRERQTQRSSRRSQNNQDDIDSGKNPQRDGPPKKGPPPFKRITKRLILADSDKQALIGMHDKKKVPLWQPINHEDKVVGYLALRPLRQVENQFDQAFEKQQYKSFALAGISMVLLSALLAAPLASRIVRPIVNVQKSVAKIGQGKYGQTTYSDRSDEIGDLTSDIHKLDNILEHNRDARQRMFAEISHELRTPVAVLRSELEALQDGIRALDGNAVSSLHTETMKLNRLIDDLKTLSLSDTGAFEFQMLQLDLSALLRNQIKRFKASDANIEISTNIEPSLTINGDCERLEQLISNLMQNSIRYTDAPCSIDISLQPETKAVTGQQFVRLDWSDSKPGVPDAALAKLFDPLFRTEPSRSRKLGGSGLGLSIVKKIVAAHNGSCTARHSSKGGLSIQIHFPTTSPGT